MTYSDRSRRDDERRRQDEKRRQDEQRRKAAEQKAIDDRRRADAAKAKQKQPPQPAPKSDAKPAPKPDAKPNTPSTPVPSPTPKRFKKTDLSAIREPALRAQEIVNQQRDARQQALLEPEPPKPFWETMFQPDPPKYKGFLEKVGELGGKAWNASGRAANTVKSFGSGFFGQSMDNQATTPIQDAINPQAGKARQDWLERESQNSGAFDAGRKAADVVNTVQGAGQITVGGVGIGGGTILSGTGGGAAIGVPAIAGSTVIAGHGAGTAQRAISHLMHGSGGPSQREPDPKDRIQHEEHKRELRREMEKPHVTDPKLRKITNKLYRDDAELGSGSTAEAIRYERETGLPVKGSFHSQKGRESIKNLNDWLRDNPKASPGDRAAAESMLRDLKNAFGED